MEEVVTPKREKYFKVEQKIEMLAQSKLQNISEHSLKHIQDRINGLQKKLMDEVTSKEASVRDYRLKLTTFQDQNREIDQRLKTSLKDRWGQIRQLRQELAKFMQKQEQERVQKELWSQSNCEQKMEKVEKQLGKLKQDKKQEVETLYQKIKESIEESQSAMATVGGAIDELLSHKMNNVEAGCQDLRTDTEKEMEKGERREKELMQFLRGVVSEMKEMIAEEKRQRQSNRDKLRLMMQEATKNLNMQ